MKIWSLQLLRFFAALAVVIYHADWEIFHATHRFGVLGLNGAMLGQAGVDIFFVLSGVVIATSSKGLTARAFAIKRATRILPLYAAIAVLYLAARLFAGTLGWREAVSTVFLWPALDRMTDPVVPVAWTLCFEVLFYSGTALVLWRPRLAWLLAAIFAGAMSTQSWPITRFIGSPLILEFLVGVGLTRLPKTGSGIVFIPVGLALLWLFGSEGYPTTSGALNGEMVWQRALYFGLPAAMIVWGTLQLSARKGLLSYLGDTSYALYLTHVPVVIAITQILCHWTTLPADLVAVAATAASVIVGWRVHEVIEKPLLAWVRRPATQPALA